MRAIRKPLLGITAAVAVTFASGFAAGAGTLSYEGPGVWGSPALNANVSYKLDGATKSHGAGLFRMKDEDGNSLLTWCIDLFNTVKNHWEYTAGKDFVPVPGQVNTAAVTSNIKKLFTAHYADALASASNAAAFQLALWEITVDTQADGSGLDLTVGRFQKNANGSVYNTAANFLASVPGAGEDGYGLTFFDSVTDANGRASQNLVSATPVPLPAGFLLLATGMAGLGIMRRRRDA